MTRCRRETPTAMMRRKKRTRRRTKRGTISRLSSGNPNPTNSPKPLYETYACSSPKTRPCDPCSFLALSDEIQDYSDGKGRVEVAEHRCRRFTCRGEEILRCDG